RSLSNEETINNYETHNMLLYGLCTLSFDELTSTPWSDKLVIKGCFQALLDQLYWSHLPVVTAAADCLITFAQNSSLWCEDDEIYFMILQDVFGNLIGALNEHIALQKTSHRNGRGFIIAKIFYCLLEWLMIIPSNLFTDTELCQLVFDSIEMACDVSNSESNKFQKKASSYNSKSKRSNNDHPIKFKKAEKKISVNREMGDDISINVFGADNSVEDVNFVKDIAEFVLLHLTHHLGNFSPIHGPGPIGTDTKDDELSNNYHYFSFNDTTIITLVEIPGKSSSGKYSWDSKLFYENKPFSTLNTLNNLIKPNNTVCENMIFRPDIKLVPNYSGFNSRTTLLRMDAQNISSKIFDGLPALTENCQSERTNMLDNILQYIGEQVTYSQYEATNQMYPQRSIELSSLEKELDRHTQEEFLYDKSTDLQAQSWYDNDISLRNSILQDDKINKLSRNPLYSRSTSYFSLGADFSLSKSFLPALPPVAEKHLEPYQQCRLFLSHFGWLTPESLNDDTICVLHKGNTLFRDIRLLDKRHAREVFKFALLYVGPGQEDEQSILHNTNGSEEYNEFVQSLGWEIDLTTHPGYLGGLERNASNGLTAIYYCTSTIEIIFHDVTKMPTDPNDPKQLRKKRHIGNDHVHIIWNEHYRDYRKGTIGGDFGNAQIVISPLPNGLYNVDIYRDSKIPPFGPLLHGMIISRSVLGPLVRMTAIQAYRN
ncbi:5398_t:CDS:10, partial [Funneliformis geosporum]